MSYAFNPFAQNAVQQPTPAAVGVAPPAAPAPAPQRPVASSMNDADQYDGFTTPYLNHIDCDIDIQVTDFKGLRTPKLGRASHIFFTVLTSNVSTFAVGSEYRIAYKYDFERSEKSDKDEYGADMRALGLFVQALFNQKVAAGFNAQAAEKWLHTPEGQAWLKAEPRCVHLHGKLGKPKTKTDQKTGAQATTQFRNDFWMPVRRG